MYGATGTESPWATLALVRSSSEGRRPRTIQFAPREHAHVQIVATYDVEFPSRNSVDSR
ncbi:MAG: hypothetical protein ACJAV2_004533 [Myxococcota bacterium]|jgi:hypothetical protein